MKNIMFYGVLLFLSVYSYSLVDPNLTLVNNPAWTGFRNYMVNWGYFRRDQTSIIYILIISILFLFHYLSVRNFKKIPVLKMAGIIFVIMFFSYPLLSHDFFNYIFDAKILTYYHQNPYLHKALDFPNDPWLRFMHWTHRVYPYGPVFLVITLVPSFLSFGKFILAYGLFKVLFLSAYVVAVFYLNKLNKKWAVIFATHPLIIIEGLLNMHNDLIGVCLAVSGIYFLLKKRNIQTYILLAASIGIKYMTLPFLFVSRKRTSVQIAVFIAAIVIILYISFRSEIQPWYFLTVFAMLPFFESTISRFNIFFAGLLFSYYPYIRFGGWDKPVYVDQKHSIILAAFIMNLIYIGYKYFFRKSSVSV